jgi:membrane-associated phospholipid phosphatase
VIAAIANSRIKISLHTLFASYCTVILFRIGMGCGVAALLLGGLVFWSRLYLGRHTVAETLAGVGVGIGGGILAAWWP